MKEQTFYSKTRIDLTLIIGLVSLTIGLSLVNMQVSKIKVGIVAKATVIQVESKSDHEGAMYKPVLKFINNQNMPMIFKPHAWSADDWNIGETVKLLYTKDHYDTVSMLTYWKTFGVALTFCCVAIVSLFMAGGEFLAVRFFKTLKYPDALT